jgi:hypothetical protein
MKHQRIAEGHCEMVTARTIWILVWLIAAACSVPLPHAA